MRSTLEEREQVHCSTRKIVIAAVENLQLELHTERIQLRVLKG
jgi:hypothetical protein